MEQIPLYKGSLFLSFQIDIVSLSLIALAPTSAHSPVVCLNPLKISPVFLIGYLERLRDRQEPAQVKHRHRWRATHSLV